MIIKYTMGKNPPQGVPGQWKDSFFTNLSMPRDIAVATAACENRRRIINYKESYVALIAT